MNVDFGRWVERRGSIRHALLLASLLAPLGCAADATPMYGDEEDPEPYDAASSEVTAGDMSSVSRSACSTEVARGLSTQLVGELGCLSPGSMESISGIPRVTLGSAVQPYLQRSAVEALTAAARRGGSAEMQLTSALRTLPQQYLVWRWYNDGRCGIGLAARPGRSNHESGLAIDVANYGTWRSTLQAAGFRWAGSSDPVHFDYVGSGTQDIRSLSVKAFQRLWNLNNPGDRISEDGAYGPQTESRLARSPSAGFASGADCETPAPPEDPPPPVDPPAMPPPDAGMPPPTTGPVWQSVYVGLSLDGSQVPRSGISNRTLGRTETIGNVAVLFGNDFVQGTLSWFGGPTDTGVSSTETGAITGERLRSLNSPMSPSASDLSSRPQDFYYCAMRWDYSPNGTSWWARQRLLVVNPATGVGVVVRPVDWGPATSTGRIIDLSHQTLVDLGLDTDQRVLVAFAAQGAPLGRVR